MMKQNENTIGGVSTIADIISAGGLSAFDVQGQWPKPKMPPMPANPSQLDKLILPFDLPLPPSWRAWLAYDTAWLTSLGWFKQGAPLKFTPLPLRKIVAKRLGSMWAPFFDTPRFEHCFLLPGGSDSLRVLVLTSQPDEQGEHPVLFVDVDDMPCVGAMFAGLDIYLGWLAGLVKTASGDYTTYTDTAKLPFQSARCAHHVENLLDGQWEVSFPKDSLR